MEAKLIIIGLEGKQRRQKNDTPSPVKEPEEGHETSFWRALRGETGPRNLVMFFRTLPGCLEKTYRMTCRK
jgi:hypothetical protein